MVDLDNTKMSVEKDRYIYSIEFDGDEGDCCGYYDIENNLLFDKDHIDNNPVITNIEEECGERDCCEQIKITLFGEYKPIVIISAEAGSGSGWQYGAIVRVKCKPLEIEDVLVNY